jgi:hypothetical protein
MVLLLPVLYPRELLIVKQKMHPQNGHELMYSAILKLVTLAMVSVSVGLHSEIKHERLLPIQTRASQTAVLGLTTTSV